MPIKRRVLKRYLKILIVSMIVFLTVSLFVISLGTENDPTILYNIKTPDKFDYSNSNADISSVPRDKLDFDKVQQFGRENDLTLDQLTYKDALGTPNINKIKDWNKLNQAVRDQALQQLTGKTIATNTGGKAVKGEVTDTGFKLDSIDMLQVDGTVLNGGINVVYENEILTAEHADSFVKAGAVSSNVDYLSSEANVFSVEQADSVMSDCISVNNVKDSTFTIYGNAVEIVAGKGVVVDIEDCSNNNVKFESNNGKIIISKQVPTVYNIENGSLTYKGTNFTEKIDANNSAKVELDPNFGFSCMLINPVGTYWYSEDNILKDFGVNIPEDSSQYKLCIRKNIIQNFETFDGLIDFVKKEINLYKIVNYLRYPFENNQLLSLSMDMVYEGEDIDTKSNINLDGDFVFLNKFFIANNNAENEISIARSSYHEIIEIKGTRFAKIHREKFYPDLINEYKKILDNAIITIKNKILTQNGNTKVKILSVNSPDVNKAELFLQNYWNRNQNEMLIWHLE